jgi:hypothetical protein
MATPAVARRGLGIRPPHWRRWFAATGAVILIASVNVFGSAPAGAVLNQSTSGCPTGDTCASIPWTPPGGTPCTTDCPMVEADPTSDLGPEQAVNLTLVNFPMMFNSFSPSIVYVEFCSDSTLGECITNYPPTGSGLSAAELIGLTPDTTGGSVGSATASLMVESHVPGEGNPPYQGNHANQSFYCGVGTTDQCAIEVTIGDALVPDGSGGVLTSYPPTTGNTAVIPVTFGPTIIAGCTDNSPSINSVSGWTLSQLIPAVNTQTCQSSGMFDLNEPVPSDQIAAALSSGQVQIGYTDEPQSATVQALLATGKYKLIPLALSATVEATLVSVTRSPTPDYGPISAWDMTPTDVAVALTAESPNYTEGIFSNPPNLEGGPYVSSQQDSIRCPNPGGKLILYCPLPQVLNQAPPGFNFDTLGVTVQVASFYSGSSSGTNQQLLDWLCTAPNLPVSIDNGAGQPTSTYHDAYSGRAAVETTTPGWGTRGFPYPLAKACSHLVNDTIPALNATPNYSYQVDVGSPQQEAVYLYEYDGLLPGTTENSYRDYAGLAPMDWSQAAYNGLQPALLQNASGQWVAPSAQSLDAALTVEGTTQSDGAITFSYRPKDPNDSVPYYPMPMISYAVVPTTPLPASEASPITKVLRDLLSITSTGGANSAELPPGYAPLPTDLSQTAATDLTNDIHTIVAPVVTTTTVPTSTSTTVPTTATTSPAGTSVGSIPTTPGATPAGSKAPSDRGGSSPAATGAPTSTSPSSTSPGPLAALGSFVLGGPGGGWVVPAIIALLVLGLAGGPLLIAYDRRRHRKLVQSND